MLEISELVKVYPGPVAALQGIQLQIPQGMFGLLGPNGSGKSTLMRIVAGLLEPTAGRVSFAGDDVTERPDLIWHRLGYLPQDFGFYPNSTGKAMLLHLLRLKGIVAPHGLDRLADQLLERVNLRDAARRPIAEYSGGMRQRLGIAQAIAGDPALVVVDEPTAGLDPEERIRFYELLAELAETRIVLLSTHLVEDVAVLCPRFAVISAGRLITTTTPAAAREPLGGKIFESSSSAIEREAVPSGVRIIRSYFVAGRRHLRLFVADGSAPEGFSPAAPTLEDAYLLLTRPDEPSHG